MAERPTYVKHRAERPKPKHSVFAVIVGVFVAFAAVAGVAFGISKALGSDDPPPPTSTASTIPAKPTIRIIFPEGFTRAQMAKRVTEVDEIAKNKRGLDTSLTAKAYLQASKKGPVPADFKGQELENLEGFLFPATYDFTEDTTSKELVLKQLDAFSDAWAKVDMKYAESKNLTAVRRADHRLADREGGDRPEGAPVWWPP